MQSISRKLLNLFCAVALFNAGVAAVLGANRSETPDGKGTMAFSLKPGGVPVYGIEYLGKPIVLESRLGLEPGFSNGFQLINSTESRHSGSWTNAFGERRLV